MPLVPAKCPECGGLVEVDNEKRAGLCQHCGQPFVVEDAIQIFNTYYQTTNNYNTTHNYGEGAVVNIVDEKNNDSRINSAIASLFELNDLEAALEKFKSVADDDASDYRGWLGLAIVETKKFLKEDYQNRYCHRIKKYMNNACQTAPNNISQHLEEINNLLSSYNSYTDEIRDINSKIYDININISKLNERKEKVSKGKDNDTVNKVHPALWIAIGITLFLAIFTYGVTLLLAIPLSIVAGIWYFISSKSISKKMDEINSKLYEEKENLNVLNEKKEKYKNYSDNLSGILAIDNLDKSIFNFE